MYVKPSATALPVGKWKKNPQWDEEPFLAHTVDLCINTK